mmetsp:Transcript_36789/g.118362  ORF Transcript_36789/g.118362 Transcript_36789/m.118362 type:complete len:316 (-) Transcript_36789:63-1010(-)
MRWPVAPAPPASLPMAALTPTSSAPSRRSDPAGGMSGGPRSPPDVPRRRSGHLNPRCGTWIGASWSDRSRSRRACWRRAAALPPAAVVARTSPRISQPPAPAARWTPRRRPTRTPRPGSPSWSKWCTPTAPRWPRRSRPRPRPCVQALSARRERPPPAAASSRHSASDTTRHQRTLRPLRRLQPRALPSRPPARPRAARTNPGLQTLTRTTLPRREAMTPPSPARPSAARAGPQSQTRRTQIGSTGGPLPPSGQGGVRRPPRVCRGRDIVCDMRHGLRRRPNKFKMTHAPPPSRACCVHFASSICKLEVNLRLHY